ncbi:MAG: type II toxin-antitoxin system HipA family toxin [Deltaproteobacteria bacterium]|nr:type II toxin-antitoxin system HipA family toxin [Deltaproteobacteria bacterium]
MNCHPVFARLFDRSDPLLVGTLSHDESGGAFQYDTGYLASGSRALEPVQLRHRGSRPIKIKPTDREGIPGVLADTGPDGWGRKVLEQRLCHQPDALEALLLTPDDGAGRLTVGEKPPQHWPGLADLPELIKAPPLTALGGEKPKTTIQIDGQLWIAKWPEHDDPPHLPFYEAAALRMASRLGMPAADSMVHQMPDGCYALLVKRFDRLPDGTRLPFASALTALGPGGQVLGSGRSYLALASALVRWTRDARAPAGLWPRIALNGLLGNIDDHPRNHGLLFQDGRWRLSPVFDVVPAYIRREVVDLAMPFLQVGSRLSAVVSAQPLVQAASAYGYDEETARIWLKEAANRVVEEWHAVLEELDAPAEVGWETRYVGRGAAVIAMDSRQVCRQK